MRTRNLQRRAAKSLTIPPCDSLRSPQHEDDWYFSRGDDGAFRSEVLVSDSDSDDDGEPTRRDLPEQGEMIARDMDDMGFSSQ